MHYKNNCIVWLAALALSLFAVAAQAEKFQDFGEHVVHFNALTTDLLPPRVATEYGITRSHNRGMINVVVLRKVLGASGKPVAASVQGTATNLTGQQRALNLQEVREPNAIYYIAEFGISNGETMDFELALRPEGTEQTLNVRFQQQFFTN